MAVIDPQAPVSITAHELYRFYHAGDDEVLALRGVSMAAVMGEVVAVVGPSGSGKSTLLACLGGLDDPDGGWVEVSGVRLSRRDESERAALRARSLGVLRQSGNLFDHLSLKQNVRAAQMLAPDARRPRPIDLLASVGIAGRATARPSTLSGGEAARAGLAVALANDPPILLADEPTGEVDERNERVILDLLRERAELGTAVIVVTHSERVAAAADRVLGMRDGKLDDG